VGLVETHSTIERMVSHGPWCTTHIHFVSHGGVKTAGLHLAIATTFLESAVAFDISILDSSARVLHFWSDHPKGSFDVFLAYFDVGDAAARKKLLVLISKHKRPHAHTILMGDLNLTLDATDRITADLKFGKVPSGIDINYWRDHFHDFTEFEQPNYTCMNTKDGHSKLDRVLTSCGVLGFCTLASACNTLAPLPGLSDHVPVSWKFF